MKRAADWERLLSSAASVSRVVPDSVFDDALSPEPEAVRQRFARALADLERVAGWLPTPVGRLVIADGKLDGVHTTIGDQTRFGPLETMVEAGPWGEVVVPTLAEMLRVKAWLVISRNASRDYVDAGALAERLGRKRSVNALSSLDCLYPQTNGSSAIQQAARQLAEPRPFDLEDVLSAHLPFSSTLARWVDAKRRCIGLAADLVLAARRRLTGSSSGDRSI